jgi:hypothetical protein
MLFYLHYLHEGWYPPAKYLLILGTAGGLITLFGYGKDRKELSIFSPVYPLLACVN